MKIKKITILLIIVSILSMNFSVYAGTNKYSITLNANTTTIKAGNTVTLSLKVDNINIQTGEKGIGAYEGTIVYDTNIFEDIKMKGNENWDTPTLNEGRFTSVKSDGLCTSESQEIASITLKVKDNATSGSTKVQIKDFEASNGQENIATENKEITLNIEGIQSSNEDNKNNTPDTNTNTNTNTSTNNKNNTTEKDTNTSTSVNNKNYTTNQNTITNQNKLPHTGVSPSIGIFIIVLAVIGIYSYIRYNRTC